MNMIHIDKPDDALRAIFHAAYPNYTGRKFRVRTASVIDCATDNSWQGGSRTYYTWVDLSTRSAIAEVPAQSQFDPKINGAKSVTIPENKACVEHRIFCGRDMGLTLVLSPENATQFLPTRDNTLTIEQKIVLCATRSLKSSYGGIPNYRFHEASGATGISKDAWENGKRACIESDYLNKAGAITASGRNVISDVHDLRSLRVS